MSTLKIVIAQTCSMVCPVKPEFQDDDWTFLIYEINMNFTVDSVRAGYEKQKKKEKEYVESDMLRMAGYTEEDILNRLE